MPAGAIVFDCNGLHALVVENGVAKSREITQIRDLGTAVEVGDGDKVVLNPPVDLEDGGKVQIGADAAHGFASIPQLGLGNRCV